MGRIGVGDMAGNRRGSMGGSSMVVDSSRVMGISSMVDSSSSNNREITRMMRLRRWLRRCFRVCLGRLRGVVLLCRYWIGNEELDIESKVRWGTKSKIWNEEVEADME